MTIEAEIYRQAGRPFNIGSAPQLRQVLFEELEAQIEQEDARRRAEHRSGGSGRTRAQASVAEVPDRASAAFAKLKSTYLDALPTMVHADGRMHASFNQVVAATGRLSSSDPNLQNIPVRTEDGRQIRQAFLPGVPRLVAPDGGLFADRASDPGALLGRPGAGQGVRRRPRHPFGRRRPGSSASRSRPSPRTIVGWPRRSTSA